VTAAWRALVEGRIDLNAAIEAIKPWRPDMTAEEIAAMLMPIARFDGKRRMRDTYYDEDHGAWVTYCGDGRRKYQHRPGEWKDVPPIVDAQWLAFDAPHDYAPPRGRPTWERYRRTTPD
jgi:hypothetical protein